MELCVYVIIGSLRELVLDSVSWDDYWNSKFLHTREATTEDTTLMYAKNKKLLLPPLLLCNPRKLENGSRKL